VSEYSLTPHLTQYRVFLQYSRTVVVK